MGRSFRQRAAAVLGRRKGGVAVFFGMLGVTMFGLIFTPIFYMLVRRLADPRPRRE